MNDILKIDRFPDVQELDNLEIKEDDFLREQLAIKPDAVDTKQEPSGEKPGGPENIAPLPEEPVIQPQPKIITPDQQRQKVKTFLFLRNLGIAAILSLYIRDFKRFKEFKLTDAEMETLLEVYMQYAYLFDKMPPFLDLLAVEAMVLIPKFIMAQKIIDERKTVEKKAGEYRQNNPQAETTNTRLYYQVDETGRYVYQERNRIYVKKDSRIMADVASEYEKLVEANGIEKIHKIFNIDR